MNATLKKNKSSDQVCVSCFTEYGRDILASNYDDRCPKVMKQITVKENAKWFNKELHEAKKKKKKSKIN